MKIRPPEAGDYDRWLPLWEAYQDFFNARLPGEVTRNTFAQMAGETGAICGFVAEDNAARLVGFVTYFFHPTTFSLGPRCYLEDLFTHPDARGQGVGRLMIERVIEAAQAGGAEKLYWHTRDNNYPGRALYDKLAEVSHIKYEKKLRS